MSEEIKNEAVSEEISSSFIDDFIIEDLAEGGRCEGMKVHTDVYKRQGRNGAGQLRGGYPDYHGPEYRYLRYGADLLRGHTDCLLYTSSCSSPNGAISLNTALRR